MGAGQPYAVPGRTASRPNIAYRFQCRISDLRQKWRRHTQFWHLPSWFWPDVLQRTDGLLSGTAAHLAARKAKPGSRWPRASRRGQYAFARKLQPTEFSARIFRDQ